MIRKPKRNNPRATDAYDKFRKEVLKRDKRKCQMPGCDSTRRLQVHHIVKYANNGYGRLLVSNGITLCFNCHKNKVTGNESIYAPLFTKIVGENVEKQNKKRPS